MEEFNFQGFKSYSKHLSPLGNQILNVLVNNLKKDRHKYQRRMAMQPPPPQRERRILSFNPEPEPQYTGSLSLRQAPSELVLAARTSPVDDDADFDFPAAMAPLPPHVPTSTQLLKSPSDHCEPENRIQFDCTREDLFDIPNYPKSILARPQANLSDAHSSRYTLKSASVQSNRNESEKISWDNMFDSEIIPDLPVVDNAFNYIALSEHNAAAKCYTTDTQTALPQKDKTSEDPKKTSVEIISDIQIVPPKKRKKAVKAKNDESKKPKMTTKKTRNNAEMKDLLNKEISYKKANYNVSVQKWVNEVNPNNAVEEEGIQCASAEAELATSTDKIKPLLTIEKSSKTKKNKKVVQSKLANKDGVMKYKKQSNLSETNEKNPEAAAKVIPNAAKPTKVKPKFVAPIKSQIPVKDVTYDVMLIDETNVRSISEINEDSVEMILIYRNGYCQLNSQHTEDACLPEGVMLRASDAFYCITSATPKQQAKVCLEDILTCKDVVCYEGKQLLMYLTEQYGIDLIAKEMRILDVKIGGSLIDPDSPPADFAQLQRLVGFEPAFTLATTCPRQKAAWYCAALRDVASKLREELEQQGLWGLYENIEVPLVPIIADMEWHGVAVDSAALATMEALLLELMQRLERRCHEAAGRPFQVTSALQVRAILYDELKLDAKCNIKIQETISTGAKSTSETMLRSLRAAHALPGLVLEYRRVHKAHATFVSGVAQHVKDGVVRPTWLQSAAATGRIACSNPNLQAIPKEPFPLDIAPESQVTGASIAGRSGGSLSFRSVYVARAGRVLLAADFRHVECRLLAHAAGDARLRSALTQPDLFRTLAGSWLRAPPADVTPQQRERTKRVLYAAVYGAGAARLHAMLQIPYDEARAAIASFNRSFPSLKAFGAMAAARCLAGGGRVSTAAGRARRLPDIAAPHAARRAHAERQALNFLVQGAAADVCKAAMAGAVRALRIAGGAAGGARLLLQIHDELLWEVGQEQLQAGADIIRSAMEQCGAACGLALTLPVSLSAGPSWGELAPLPPLPPPGSAQPAD